MSPRRAAVLRHEGADARTLRDHLVIAVDELLEHMGRDVARVREILSA